MESGWSEKVYNHTIELLSQGHVCEQDFGCQTED